MPRRCLDVCFQKFNDTAELVATEPGFSMLAGRREANRAALKGLSILGSFYSQVSLVVDPAGLDGEQEIYGRKPPSPMVTSLD